MKDAQGGIDSSSSMTVPRNALKIMAYNVEDGSELDSKLVLE